MPFSVYIRWLCKAGNRSEEYEDAFWPARSHSYDVPVIRCAVADGATESAFSGAWARQLVYAWGQGRLEPTSLLASIVADQAAWQRDVDARQLAWYAEEKARSGAFAALLGVTVKTCAPDRAHWSALSVGDCALFHVRNGRLVASFPAEDADFFTNRPLLISSKPERNAAVGDNQCMAEGDLQSGDRLYLATDALAQWVVHSVEADEAPWDNLDVAISGRRARFAAWVEALRTSGTLRNDDVTVLRITWQAVAQ